MNTKLGGETAMTGMHAGINHICLGRKIYLGRGTGHCTWLGCVIEYAYAARAVKDVSAQDRWAMLKFLEAL